MLQQLIREFVRQARSDHNSEVRFRNDYSGRGMYGRKCIGITGSMSECSEVIANTIIKLRENFKQVQLGSTEDEQDRIFAEAVNTLLDSCEDSMGRDRILYWPELTPIEEENVRPDMRDFDDYSEFQQALEEWKDAQEKV